MKLKADLWVEQNDGDREVDMGFESGDTMRLWSAVAERVDEIQDESPGAPIHITITRIDE